MNVKKNKSLVYSFIIATLKLVKNIITLDFSYPKLGTIFYFEPSLNNRKSLKGTKTEIPSDLIVSCQKYHHFFPEAWVYIYSFSHIVSFFRFYNSLNKEDSRLVRFYFLDFFLSMGYYITIEKCLKKNPQLKAIAMANDHLIISMCLKELAPKYDIKTIYTQHASVTEKFPSLNFDYSFLDGAESYEKYKKIGNIRGNVYLSGSPRFDDMYSIISKDRKNCAIGIAINSLDNISKVKRLCLQLINEGYKDLILRPHPTIEKLDWESFKILGIEFSMPSEEYSFLFLNRISYLISNESGIHLDAAMINVSSILYNFSDHGILDWYGYIRTGLVPVASSYEELLIYLKVNKPINNELVQYYVASHNTQLQGRIGKVISEYLSAIIEDKNTGYLDEKYFSNLNKSYFVIKK